MDTLLKNHIKGMIYGQALGDAVGLIAEYKTKRDKIRIEYPYTESILDFPPSDWTDDTDHMVLMMEMLTEAKNMALPTTQDYKLFLTKLSVWKKTGFIELGDRTGRGIGGTIKMVTNNFETLYNNQKNMFHPAKEVWVKSGCRAASNGAISRMSIFAVVDLLYKLGCVACDVACDTQNEQMFGMKKGQLPTTPTDIIQDLCQLTHYDGRCVLSCQIYVKLLSFIINAVSADDPKNTHSALSNIDLYIKHLIRSSELSEDCEPVAGSAFKGRAPTPRTWAEDKWYVPVDISDSDTEDDEPYLRYNFVKELIHYNSCSLIDLKLDENGRAGYTYKALGVALWSAKLVGLCQRKVYTDLDFKKIITTVVKEGGESNTNGSIAGSIIGCYMGYDALPQDWLSALPNAEWLDKKIDKFFEAVEKV